MHNLESLIEKYDALRINHKRYFDMLSKDPKSMYKMKLFVSCTLKLVILMDEIKKNV